MLNWRQSLFSWMGNLGGKNRILQGVANYWLTGRLKTQFLSRNFESPTWAKAKQAFARWHTQDFTVHKNDDWRVEPFLGSKPRRCACCALAGPVTAGQQLCGDLGKYRALQHCSTLQLGRGLQIACVKTSFSRGAKEQGEASGAKPQDCRLGGKWQGSRLTADRLEEEQLLVPPDQIDNSGR